MNELATIDASILNALRTSLYPGAKDESIEMVLSYCKAAKLDPMQKPVHIVSMSVTDKKTGKKEDRDIVMPGIGLYRIQAERSGNYAGLTEEEYGPDITEDFNGIVVTYPEWCKLSVKKVINNNIIGEFSSGKRYWKENYATKGAGSNAPNVMWTKRPKEQLAKCAEAHALRRAFPDIVGQQPTAEEMEGKSFDTNVYEAKKEQPAKIVQAKHNHIEIAQMVQPETLDELHLIIQKLEIKADEIEKWLKKASVDKLELLNEAQASKIIEMLLKRMQ
jgi:phage recombination protein Bet